MHCLGIALDGKSPAKPSIDYPWMQNPGAPGYPALLSPESFPRTNFLLESRQRGLCQAVRKRTL